MKKGGINHGSPGASSTDIITTARRLGIQVINVSELERYIEKYMMKKRSIESNTAGNAASGDLNVNNSQAMTLNNNINNINATGNNIGNECDQISYLKKANFSSEKQSNSKSIMLLFTI